jgi:hypothetical protein
MYPLLEIQKDKSSVLVRDDAGTMSATKYDTSKIRS